MTKSPAALSVMLAAIVVGMIIGSRADAADKVALQLRWEPQFQSAGYFAALWQGYYDEAGLDVEIRTGIRPDRGQVESLDEVLSGRAQFGIAGADLAVAHAASRPVVVVADIFQHSAISVITLKDANVSSPADLVGMRIRRIKSDMGDVEFQAMMRAEGLDPDAAVAIYAEADGRGLALLRDGQIDAYIGYHYAELWRARAAGLQITQLRPSAYGVDFYGDTLFTSKSMRDLHPDVVQRFRDASLRGWKYALANRAEVAKRLADEFPRFFVTGDVLAYENFLAEQIAEWTLYPMIEMGHINPARWSNIHQTLKNTGLLSGNFNARDFIFDPEAEQAERTQETLRYLILIAAAIAGLLVAAGFWMWTLKSQIRERTRELTASEERYALASSGADEGIWDWNIVTGEEYFSPRWKGQLGFDDDEIENRQESFFERLHPDDVQAVETALKAHFEHDVPYVVELRLRHRDGNYRWFVGRGKVRRDVSGRPIRMVGSNRDITERKEAQIERRKAEIALAQSQTFLRSITDNLPVSINFVDKDLRYRCVNRTSERWYGSPAAEMIGRSLSETATEAAQREAGHDRIDGSTVRP